MTLDATRGIDVSAIGQGKFDWQRWEGHIDFAMAKATEATDFIDPEFARNWDHMLSFQHTSNEAFFRFAYHYFRPSVDPASQAHFFVRTVMSLGFIPGKDHMVLDHEEMDGLNPVDVSFAAWVCTREITRLIPESRLVVYTYPFFAEQGNCAKLGDYALWIADYGVPAPYVPVPWAGRVPWSIWQDSVHHYGNKDIFNGDDRELQEFCSSTGLWTD